MNRFTRHLAATALLLVGCGGASDERPPDSTTTTTGEGGAGGGAPVDAGAELDCAPGDLLLGDGSCVSPGIHACAEGFSSDGQQGCDAILPATPCASGFMAVPGDETCEPVAACGTGPYDGIPVEPDTVYVDPSYGGGSSDGSLGMPFTTVDQALQVAPDGAIVALAPGAYGPVVVASSVRLWATCPDAVSFAATSGAAIRIEADGVELHRLSVTGRGVVVDAAASVRLSEVRLHDTGNEGLVARNGADVTLADSLVERTTARGVMVQQSSAVTVERCEIRDGVPNGSGIAHSAVASNGEAMLAISGSWLHHAIAAGVIAFGAHVVVERSVVSDSSSNDDTGGAGIIVQLDGDDAVGQLELRDVVVERSVHHGIVVQGSELDAERLIVRDVVTHGASTSSGRCMRILAQNAIPPVVRLSEGVVARCQDAGILATQADLLVEQTIVRDVEPHPVTNLYGFGLVASSRFGVPTTLSTRGLVIERTATAGLLVSGSIADVDSVLTREPLPVAEDELGFGVVFAPGLEDGLGAQGSARQIVIEDAVTVGFAALLSDVDVEHLLVRNTGASSAGFGDGMAVSGTDPNVTFLTGTASLQASAVTIEGSERAGLAVFSADVAVDHGLFDCNTIHLNVETIEGVGEASLVDAGNNVCGCDGTPTVCKVQSSGLEPPSVY